MTDWFNDTGERQILHALLRCNIRTIFDVGANRGLWSKMARGFFPDATIHAFEVVPDTFRQYLNNVNIDSKIIPNNFGLSEEIQSINIKYCNVNDTLSTAIENMAPGTVGDIPWEWRKCLTVSGDFYVESNKIDHIDFLKIDVEGIEHLVLKGFKNALSRDAIGIIQFEYGTANILSRWQLRDFYELLSPLGYIIGQLRVDCIDFRQYNLTHENYGADGSTYYIAVHQSRVDILNVIQGN